MICPDYAAHMPPTPEAFRVSPSHLTTEAKIMKFLRIFDLVREELKQ